MYTYTCKSHMYIYIYYGYIWILYIYKPIISQGSTMLMDATSTSPEISDTQHFSTAQSLVVRSSPL